MYVVVDLMALRPGDTLTIRYPNGILQEALVVSRDDDGILSLCFGNFIDHTASPILDISLSASGEWTFGAQ